MIVIKVKPLLYGPWVHSGYISVENLVEHVTETIYAAYKCSGRRQAIGLRLLGVSSQPFFLVESLRSSAVSTAEFQEGHLESKASYRYDTHHVMDVMLLFATVCSLHISKEKVSKYCYSLFSTWTLCHETSSSYSTRCKIRPCHTPITLSARTSTPLPPSTPPPQSLGLVVDSTPHTSVSFQYFTKSSTQQTCHCHHFPFLPAIPYAKRRLASLPETQPRPPPPPPL